MANERPHRERNVEQKSLGFYNQPKDQNEAGNLALRILYDRWCQFYTKPNGTVGFVLMKLSDHKADKNWQQTGLVSHIFQLFTLNGPTNRQTKCEDHL